MKNWIFVLALVSSFAITRPAQATVGLLTLNGPMALAGLATFSVGGYIGYSMEEHGSFRTSNRKLNEQLYKFTFLSVLIGAAMLEGNETFTFSEISETDASKINLTTEELASFNSELDQANALIAQVSEELSRLQKPSLDESQNVWASLKDTVSPETFSVMQKITTQVYR